PDVRRRAIALACSVRNCKAAKPPTRAVADSMCGIAGIVPNRDLEPELLEGWVRRMCRSMAHRGPDDEGVFVMPDIALGMRRLSIIDVENGRQPMHSSDGRHAIVF